MNIQFAKSAPFQTAGTKATISPAVLALRGWVCDRYTSAGMEGASLLAQAAAGRLCAPLRELGSSSEPMNLGWRESLAKAQPYLSEVAREVDQLMRDRKLPFIFANRCGVSLATIPAMLRMRPEAKLVWFDAHADFNTPATTQSGYLGGMVLSALCGLWNSGLGAGLSPDRLILMGVRDIDSDEGKLIAAHKIKVITAKGGRIEPHRLTEAIAGAPVLIHIDTDVVDPAYLPAEYQIKDGLRPSALQGLLRALVSGSEVVGFELAEFEAPKDAARRARAVERVMRMIDPVLLAGAKR